MGLVSLFILPIAASNEIRIVNICYNTTLLALLLATTMPALVLRIKAISLQILVRSHIIDNGVKRLALMTHFSVL